MRWLIVPLIVLLLAATPAYAVLAVDNTTTLDQDATADPWTITHTTGAGTNLLVVLCHMTSVAQTFGTVTHNGDAMTVGVIEPSSVGVTTSALWYLVNPDIGVGLTISIDLSAADDGNCVARSYTGAATPTGTTSAEGTGTAPSMAVSCSTGGEAISILGTQSIRVVTSGADQTDVINADDGSGSGVVSTEVGAATNTMSYSWSTSTDWTHAGTCVPAATATRRPVNPIIFQ